MAFMESDKYGHSRISQLHEERQYIQKKTFKNWMNTFLTKAKMEVDDIFVDLADGKKLLKLLEIISGEKLSKPNNGKMRVHKIENVNKCLAFLHTKVKLESIGAEDIVDGNKTLILGLLWTIILRFQIQDIEIEVDSDESSAETAKKHSAREALLLWCQRKTKGYPNVRVNDFSHSWRDGMAFNAMIHSHRPELIDFASLDPAQHIENLNNAFDVAHRELGIPPLLDSEDVDTAKPDERSILTYVSSYYHTFAKYNSGVISGKRITNIIAQLMEVDRCILNYETLTTNLLNWIQMKVFELNSREFPNSPEGIQNEFIRFKEYRTVEKPPKYKERSEIEALLFHVQTKMKALGQQPYQPPEGKLVHDIQKAWDTLEKSEHKRELALREEMLRLEKLNNLAESFFRKSEIRRTYIGEMIHVLSDPRYGVNLSQVEATVKKHEAICVDILSRSERVEALSAMVRELEAGNYHNIDAAKFIETEIRAQWEKILALLKKHQTNLSIASNFMNSIKEIQTIESELVELRSRIAIDANVVHLRAAEEYLQTHALMEAQITSHGDTVKRLNSTASKLLADRETAQSNLIEKEIPLLRDGIDSLNRTYAELIRLTAAKREKLTNLRDYYQILQDIDEEDASLSEKQNICQAILPGKDLLAIISLQQKHNVFEADVKAHENRMKRIEKRSSEFLLDGKLPPLIKEKQIALLEKLAQLIEMTNQKSKELADAIEAFQYHADANEAESWLREKMQLARSDDYGTDEQSAQSLLQRHSRLQNEVTAYQHDIDRLNNQSDKMINSGVENLFLLCQDPFLTSAFLTGEIQIDGIDEEEEPKSAKPTPMEPIYEDIEIDQVKVLYNFKGDNKFSVRKGEILLLLEKTTKEWWNVRRESDKKIGFVPANYVKQIEPKIVRRVVSESAAPKNAPTTQQQRQPPAVNKFNNNRRPSSKQQRRLSIVAGSETAEQRKQRINSEYGELVNLCASRREYLEESIKLFAFNRECDTLETWIETFQSSMQDATNSGPNGQPQPNQQQPMTSRDNLSKQALQRKPSETSNKLSVQFEKFITDLLANRSRLDAIDRMAKDIRLPANVPHCKRRQEALHRKWENLEFLQNQLRNSIRGLDTVEKFDAACDEAAERITDRMDKIAIGAYDSDLRTAEDLQRRHQQIERDLVPIEDTIKRIEILADNVKRQYPLQQENVEMRLADISTLWQRLRACAAKKRVQLDKMIGLQIVKNTTQELLMWINNYVKPMLAYDETHSSNDIVNLDAICKEHHELLLEIESKATDIQHLKELNAKLATQVAPEEIAMVDELARQNEAIKRQWLEKEKFLNNCREMVAFNQEADRLDTIINSHLAYLEFDNLGSNVTDVAALARQHETFTATLLGEDARVHNFVDFGEKLIQNGHFDSAKIEERRGRLVLRRKDLRDRSFARAKRLADAKVYHEIKADADEFLSWCAAKAKLIDDNELKNMNNMERKQKRHRKLEAEVRANESQLNKIVRLVAEVNKNSHFASEKLQQLSAQVVDEWTRLLASIDSKSRQFSQAFEQIEYTKSIDVVVERVTELSTIINSTEYGVDRRSCKMLMAQNKAAENEIALLEAKLAGLDNRGQQIAEDHFNSGAVLEPCTKISCDLQSLKAPLAERRRKLAEMNQFYEFGFDTDAELQWIKEHHAVAASNDVPQNLTEALMWIKKFEQIFRREIDGHENCIVRVIGSGRQLIEQKHFAAEEIEKKMTELETEWQNLVTITDARHETLKAALSVQQFLSECGDIESWMTEKANVLKSAIYGNDEITVVKLLQKQKTTDLEIDTYGGLIDELAVQAEKLPEVEQKLHASKVADLAAQHKRLQKQNNERSLSLIGMKKLHEFHRESNDFLGWIAAQRQALTTDDYGKDYEHCSALQSKFTELKRTILANEKRFKLCEEFAVSLAKGNDPDFDAQTTNTMETIRREWNELIKILGLREQHLIAAIKIHRCNRDVVEAKERIKEKFAILTNQGLGRDTHSVQNLIRKHDLFVNDLVVLEAQLQVLINDSVKLQAAYPGGNAENIAAQLKIVVEHWNKLKEKSQQRRESLFDAEAYYRFAAAARNLEQWATNLIAEMKTFETIRDIQSSQALKSTHERLKAEIDSREDEFREIIQNASEFNEKNFYNEVKTTAERLLATRAELHSAWQTKNVYLDQLIDLNCFLRDVKQLDNLYQQHQNRLASMNDFGESVEQVEASLRKHDDFIRVFETQDSKFNNVRECGQRLIEKKHYDAATIDARYTELAGKRQRLAKFIAERRDELADALIAAQFKRDVLETEAWIDEKQAQIEKEKAVAAANCGGDENSENNIERQMKRLQKHQTYEAEINANATRVADVQAKARHLIAKNYSSSIDIRTQQDTLVRKWEMLCALSHEVLQGFEEARDIYEFDRNVTQIEAWIREKQTMIHSNETGEDYEHCQSLLRKLDDVGTDMMVDENRILMLNNLANKLLHQCKNKFFNEEKINAQRDALNDNWGRLQQLISEYRARLVVSLDVHGLNRDLDDINERIIEKNALVSKECDAKSLASVEALQRKHEAIVVEIIAIEMQLKNINENDARRLIGKYPDLTEKSRNKIVTIQENIRKLNQDCKSKRDELDFAILIHKFFEAVKEIERWSTDMLANKLAMVNSAETVAEAKNDLQNHEYVKAEIAARRDTNQFVKDHGLALLQKLEQQNPESDDRKRLAPAEKAEQIEASVEKIDELRKRLDQAWEEKQHYLKQCLELQTFADLSKLCDSWLASKEALLTNDDVGSNLFTVENLLKKHETFVKSLAAQQRVTDLLAHGETLINKRHFDHETIQAKMDETQTRRDRLQEAAEERRVNLEHSKLFFQFARNANEIQRWLGEKLKVANDESYRDQINLLSKIQRHAAFEAEISANRERVSAVTREGESLISLERPDRSEEIRSTLAILEKLLRQLTEAATLKRSRLNDAYKSLQFFRLCDDLQVWIGDVEAVLRGGEDDAELRNDLTGVRNLLKKHQLMENDVHNHHENIEQVKDLLSSFTQSQHFLFDEIEERAQVVIRAYNALHEPIYKRREILEEHLAFQQFKRDIEDELAWIREKEGQLVQSHDHGTGVQELQRLLKRLKAVEAELQTREPHLSALASKGHSLIKSNNNNLEEIKQLTYELQNRVQHIKDETTLRRLALCDSLESQQFLADLAEAESWINERMPALLSDDTGKDEESVATLMHKLDIINKDTDRFNSTTFSRLITLAATFSEKNHADCKIVTERMEAVDALFKRFIELVEERRKIYADRRKYFIFERDADDLLLWIKDQLIVANSEDYGQDVEHVEKLIQQFDTFAAIVNANAERIVAIEAEAKSVPNCEAKLSQVIEQWNELREATAARQQALEGANKVHMFYQSAEETVCWIGEKESSTVLDDVNINFDELGTIQAKIRQLDGFDRDLDAVREQVEALFVEADRLAAQFPDIKTNIDERKEKVHSVWNELLAKSSSHKEHLSQIETIQSYFDEFREFITWIREMLALITADDRLGADMRAAEEQLNRHREYKSEIDARNDAFANFLSNGDLIIARGHIMSSEIEDRNRQIRSLHSTLLDTWSKRLQLYEYNVDARAFIHDSEQVDKWIDAHLPVIADHRFGDSLAEVEELLQKHQEFENAIDAQADKLRSIERITMIERYFDEQRQREEQAKIAEAEEREKARIAQLMEQEKAKIRQRNEKEEARLYENAHVALNSAAHGSGDHHHHLRGASPATDSSSSIGGKSATTRRGPSFTFSRKTKPIVEPLKIKPEVERLPIACEGYLERKQLLAIGGKRSASRSWKTYYTVLCGQLLCFFKDKYAFSQNEAASPPFSIHDAHCLQSDYRKRKFVFSIQLTDMSKYLFSASDETKLRDWCGKIGYRAQLPPSKQLFELTDTTTIDTAKPHTPSSSSDKSGAATTAAERATTNDSASSSSSRKSSLSSLPSPAPPPQISAGQIYGNGQADGYFSANDHHRYQQQQQQQPQYHQLPSPYSTIAESDEIVYTNGNGNHPHYAHQQPQYSQYQSTHSDLSNPLLSSTASLTADDNSMSHYNTTSTYQNIPIAKYRSLPPNTSPPQSSADQISLRHEPQSPESSGSMKNNKSSTMSSIKSNDSIDSTNDPKNYKENKKSKKKRSFFRRK